MKFITGPKNIEKFQRPLWPSFSQNPIDRWANPPEPQSNNGRTGFYSLPVELRDSILDQVVLLPAAKDESWYPTHCYRLLPHKIREAMKVSQQFGADMRRRYFIANTFEVADNYPDQRADFGPGGEITNTYIRRFRVKLNVPIFEKLDESNGDDEELPDVQGSEENEAETRENALEMRKVEEFFGPGVDSMAWAMKRFSGLQEIVISKMVEAETYQAAWRKEVKVEEVFPMKLITALFETELPNRLKGCQDPTAKPRRVHLEVYCERQKREHLLLGPPFSMGPDIEDLRVAKIQISQYYP